MGLGKVFKKSFGLGGDTQKDFLSPEGQFAIAIGQPGYLHEQSKERGMQKAEAAAAQNEAAVVQAKVDAQDATNKALIDAKKRRRSSSLQTTSPLGAAATALGTGGGGASAAPVTTALGAGAGY